MQGWKAKLTKPDEMPVATIVFAMIASVRLRVLLVCYGVIVG